MTLGEQRALFGIPLQRPGWGLGENLLSIRPRGRPSRPMVVRLGFFSPKRKGKGGGGSFKNEKEAYELYNPIEELSISEIFSRYVV